MQHAAQSVTVTITITDALTCWHQAIVAQGDAFLLEAFIWDEATCEPKRIARYQAGRHFEADAKRSQYLVRELRQGVPVGPYAPYASVKRGVIDQSVQRLVDAAVRLMDTESIPPWSGNT